MFAYSFSRPQADRGMSKAPSYPRPPPPSNTPPEALPEVIIQIEDDEDERSQNDGIDLSRVKEELDRLLEEGTREVNDIGYNGQDCNTIDVYESRVKNPKTTYTKKSRSLQWTTTKRVQNPQ